MGPAAEVAGGDIPRPRGVSEPSPASSTAWGSCQRLWGEEDFGVSLKISLLERRAVSAPGASWSLVSDPVPDSAILCFLGMLSFAHPWDSVCRHKQGQVLSLLLFLGL